MRARLGPAGIETAVAVAVSGQQDQSAPALRQPRNVGAKTDTAGGDAGRRGPVWRFLRLQGKFPAKRSAAEAACELGTTNGNRRVESRKVIWGAFALSVLLHLVIAAATWRIPFVTVDPQVARAAERELELFLVPAEERAAEDAELPSAYTSVPERQASEQPPEKADYLSMYHSLAADQTRDSDGDVPRAAEDGEITQVEIRQEDLAGADGVVYAYEPGPQNLDASLRPFNGRDGQADQAQDDEAPETGEWALPRPDQRRGRSDLDSPGETQEPELAEWWTGGEPSILRPGESSPGGDRGFDFDQRAQGVAGTGVAIDGNFSLNTYEWDYAPWMQHFSNELYRHWMAPYAYRLGIISGVTVIELVVEKNGRPSSMRVLESEGHESLHDASLAALKAFQPYAPLPEHFPEDHLVIQLGLHYPAWRQ